MNTFKCSSRQSWRHVSLTNTQSGFISSSLSGLWDVWNHLRRSSPMLFWELFTLDRCSDYTLVWGSSSACLRTKRRAVINATATGTFDESRLSGGFLVWRRKQEGRGIIHESWKGFHFMSDYSRWSKCAAISSRTTLEDVHSKRREETTWHELKGLILTYIRVNMLKGRKGVLPVIAALNYSWFFFPI